MQRHGLLTSFADTTSMAAILLPPEQLGGYPRQEATSTSGAAARDRNLLDALGSTVDQRQTETMAYRWHGQDTLTWGDQTEWIRINLNSVFVWPRYRGSS